MSWRTGELLLHPNTTGIDSSTHAALGAGYAVTENRLMDE